MSEYVTNGSWAGPPGRPDTIDDVADQFERRPASAPVPEPARARAVERWPRSSGGWRSVGRLHRRTDAERLAPG